jgi:F-type H+-transporting ATPase subunit delta
MRAASREALATLRREQESVTSQKLPADAMATIVSDLYAIADLLVEEPQLRRTLGDAATAPDWRAGLLASVLADKIGPTALQVAQTAARGHWSSPWDLIDALELAADDILFAAAEREGSLDEVEDELFRFGRILDAESRLTTLLDEIDVDAQRRVGLLDQVVGAKVHPITKTLLDHAVASQRKPGIAAAVGALLDEAAARRERSVARVLSAVELTDAQLARLASALTELYGRAISVRSAVDPSVRGGLVVRVGDEIIDGSVAARLNSVRAALAG